MDLTRAMLMLSGQFEPSMTSDYETGCVMAPVPDELAARLMDFARFAVPDMELYSDRVNGVYGREYELHITIKYGLQTNNPLDVMNVIEQREIAPFSVTLGQVGVFEQPLYDVVKIDVQGDSLAQLHEALKADLPNTENYPVYQPHLTLAYVKHGMGRAHVGASDFAGMTVDVDRVRFKPAAGPSRTIPLYGVEV